MTEKINIDIIYREIYMREQSCDSVCVCVCERERETERGNDRENKY